MKENCKKQQKKNKQLTYVLGNYYDLYKYH